MTVLCSKKKPRATLNLTLEMVAISVSLKTSFGREFVTVEGALVGWVCISQTVNNDTCIPVLLFVDIFTA